MSSEWNSQVYNPYPPTPPKPPKAPRSNALLYVAIGFLVFVSAILVSTYFVQAEAERQITKILDRVIAPASLVADIKYSKVKVSLWRQSVSVVDLSVRLKNSDQILLIERVALSGVDWESLRILAETRKPVVPKSLKVQFQGVQIPSGMIGTQAYEMLKGLGHDDLTLSSTVSVTRNPDRKTFDLEQFEVEVDGLGSISLAASLGDVTLPSAEEIAKLKKDPKLILTETGEFTKLTLRGFEFKFIDNSLIEKATKYFVSQGEASPVSLVDLAIETNTPHGRDVASMAATDFTLPALATLRAFLLDPSTITLASRPPNPIPLMSVLDDRASGSINDLAHKLSLSVK